MSLSENAADRKDTGNRQHALAEGCDTTIVTESAPFIYLNGGDVLRDASDQVFNSRPTRYDLLSVPSLKHLLKKQSWIDLLAHDVKTAIGLHHVERVLVAAHSVPPRPLLQQFKEGKLPPNVRLKGFSLQEPRRAGTATTIAITCMDWRLHGPGGFGPHFTGRYQGYYGVLATAGGAKELGHDTPRLEMVVSQLELAIKGLERLVLTSHTDCGKYGGAKAFASAEAEMRTLTDDLEAARAHIARAFPRLKIDIAVCRTKGIRCQDIVAV